MIKFSIIKNLSILLVVFILSLFSIVVFAAGDVEWTTTADFDSGTKNILQNRDDFARNGQTQPFMGPIVHPPAIYYNNRTYVGWQGGIEPRSVFIAYYDHSTGTWSDAIKVADVPAVADTHGAPAIIIDNDSYIHIFYGAHNTNMKYLKSDNPENITAWTSQSDPVISSTYPNLIMDGNDIYLFYRNGGSAGGYWQYVKSTDNGVSWGPVTTIIRFSGLGTYAGNFEIIEDRIHVAWAYRDSGGDDIRYNVYHAYLNITDGNMYSMNGTDLGAVINKSEADTYSLVENTTTTDETNSPALDLDANGNPYIIYPKNDSEGQWKYRFSYWNGTAWTTPENITTTDYKWNFPDLQVNSASDITAYLTTSGSAGEAGDIEKWTWNGSTWSQDSVILTEATSGEALNHPAIPWNNHSDGAVAFMEYNGSGSQTPNLKLYLWGANGFVQGRDWVYGVETNTDNPGISSGQIELASGKGDSFTQTAFGAETWRWTRWIGEDTGYATIDVENGVLNGSARWGNYDGVGVWSEFTIGGDFDVRTKLDKIAVQSKSGVWWQILNEQVKGWFQTSGTVDGILVEWYEGVTVDSDWSLASYDITDGGSTVKAGSTTLTYDPVWFRITRNDNNITTYYSSDGSNWTQHGTWTQTNLGDTLYIIYHVWDRTGATDDTIFEFDDYNLVNGTVNAGGYRTSGNWTSPTFNINSLLDKVTLTHSGLSTTYYIDKVEVLQNSAIVETFNDDITSGTQTTLTVTSTIQGNNVAVRVHLAGDGAGTPVLEGISVSYKPSPTTTTTEEDDVINPNVTEEVVTEEIEPVENVTEEIPEVKPELPDLSILILIIIIFVVFFVFVTRSV